MIKRLPLTGMVYAEMDKDAFLRLAIPWLGVGGCWDGDRPYRHSSWCVCVDYDKAFASDGNGCMLLKWIKMLFYISLFHGLALGGCWDGGERGNASLAI
ncbi:hypothetical protein CDAR_47101 [Caerostris darwini]|uniref:Uncharacterized protein n=1 Tax=Caerostris darwini TaxID=1538125 RepID=A0AAV4UAB3_9ARAC|nr:hypothetical protein CDAR_47101 [Caerostris darwini]